jgi:hypothetical protein
METIIYQGRQIEAAQIGEINSQTRAPGGGYYEATDTLWRDGSGEYYLRREDYDCQSRVHRVSLRGAALFAVELGTGSRLLRADLSEALEAPESQSASRRFADGSMDIRLRLAPEPARLFRAVCELDERSPVQQLYQAMSECVLGTLHSGGRNQEAEHEAIFDDNAPEEEEAPAAKAMVVDLLHADGSLWTRLELAADEAREIQAIADERGVSFLLEPLHAALLSRFCERQKFEVAAVAKAALVSALESIYSDPEALIVATRLLGSVGRFDPEKSAIARWEMMEQAQVSQEDMEAIAACEREDALFPGVRQLARGPYEIEKDDVIVRPWEDSFIYSGRVTRCGCYYTAPEIGSPHRLGREYTAEGIQWLAWPKDEDTTRAYAGWQQVVDAPERSPEHMKFQLFLPESGRPVEGGVRTVIKAMARWNAKHELPDEWASANIWKAAEDGRGIQIDLEAMEARERLLAQAGGEAASAQGKDAA